MTKKPFYRVYVIRENFLEIECFAYRMKGYRTIEEAKSVKEQLRSVYPTAKLVVVRNDKVTQLRAKVEEIRKDYQAYMNAKEQPTWDAYLARRDRSLASSHPIVMSNTRKAM